MVLCTPPPKTTPADCHPPRLCHNTPCHCILTVAATWNLTWLALGNPIELSFHGKKVSSSKDGFMVWAINGAAEGPSKGIPMGDYIGLFIGNSWPKSSKDRLGLLVVVVAITVICNGIPTIFVDIFVNSGINIDVALPLSANNNESVPLLLSSMALSSTMSCMELMVGTAVGGCQWVLLALVQVFVGFVLEVVPRILVGVRGQGLRHWSWWSHHFCEDEVVGSHPGGGGGGGGGAEEGGGVGVGVDLGSFEEGVGGVRLDGSIFYFYHCS